MNIYKMARISKWHLSITRNKGGHHSDPSPIISSLSTNTSLLELKRRKEAFNDVLPVVVSSFTNKYTFEDVMDFPSWIKEVLDYNLIGGKLIRGLSAVMAYEAFEKPENITDESLRRSCVLGWCVEMTYGLLIDDMMDGSVTRRGVPCWYTLPTVGRRAINDGILIFSFMNCTMKTHFGHLPQYFDLLNLINEVLMLTCAGQHLDFSMAHREKNDYSNFTKEFYNTIVKYKTSFSFKLPICLAMILANDNDKQNHVKAEEICFKIGSLFQMQDDYIDVFGLESISGKHGSDIQEGKCTWLSVTALRQCSAAQRREFVSSYGSSDPADIEKIKLLYRDLKLPETCRQEERSCYDEVVTLANNFGQNERVTKFFLELLESIYNRSK